MSRKPAKMPQKPSRYFGDFFLIKCQKAQESAEYEMRFMKHYRRDAFTRKAVKQ